MKLSLTTALVVTLVGAVHADESLLSASTSANETRALSSPLYQMCGVDFLGADVGNIKTTERAACPSLCDQQYPKCILSTWTDYQDGTCWLKSLDLDVKAVLPKVNAATYIRLEQPTKPIALAYDTRQGFAMNGFDIGSQPASDMNQCLTQCYQNVARFGVTWSSGTCYLKSRVSPLGENAGATSAFIARKDAPLSACPRV